MQGLTTVATVWGVVAAFGLHTACYIMASISFFYLAWTLGTRPAQNSTHGHRWFPFRSMLVPQFVLAGAFAMYATTLKPVGVCVSTPALPGLASGTLSNAPTTATVTGETLAATRSAVDLERSVSTPADTSPGPAGLRPADRIRPWTPRRCANRALGAGLGADRPGVQKVTNNVALAKHGFR